MTQSVLLIEDDNRLAGMIEDYLGGFGFSVTIAGTGQQGLDLGADRDLTRFCLT